MPFTMLTNWLTKETSYNTCPHSQTYECVIVGDNEMIDELNTVVKLKDADFLLSMTQHQGGQSRGQHGWVHGLTGPVFGHHK